jgi:transcriptional regulator with XRE-family HTH domain
MKALPGWPDWRAEVLKLARTAKSSSFVRARQSLNVKTLNSPLSSFAFMSSRLPNYLRSNRKRLGLSQEEVAFLLGTTNGAKVCRYERFSRLPSLETALACEVIFKISTRELFSGLYQKINHKVVERAKVLTHRIRRRPLTKHTQQKSAALGAIVAQRAKFL